MKKIPNTYYAGTVTVGEQVINCAVLFDGKTATRLFVQREVVGLLTGNKKGGLSRYLKPENLQPYLPVKFKGHSLAESTTPFRLNGRAAHGFVGEDLIDICKMYMDARSDNALLPNQIHLAIRAEIIILAFAKVGVNATIDEATGFQYIRERFAINKMLEMYVEEESQKWFKKFPDEFYRLIFQLNGWSYNPKSVKRPSVIGTWTKKLVYKRFPPAILEKLEDKNPVTEKGYRLHRHHQFLTEDIGNPDLREYIASVIFLMRSSNNWKDFMRRFERATGDYQHEIPFDN